MYRVPQDFMSYRTFRSVYREHGVFQETVNKETSQWLVDTTHLLAVLIRIMMLIYD